MVINVTPKNSKVIIVISLKTKNSKVIMSQDLCYTLMLSGRYCKNYKLKKNSVCHKHYYKQSNDKINYIILTLLSIILTGLIINLIENNNFPLNNSNLKEMNSRIFNYLNEKYFNKIYCNNVYKFNILIDRFNKYVELNEDVIPDKIFN